MRQKLIYFQLTFSKVFLIIFGYFLSCFLVSPTFSQIACGKVEDSSIFECNLGIGEGGLTVYQGLCGGLDVVFTMSSNPISPLQMCNGNNAVLNNPSYIAFIADGTGLFSITIIPIPGSCSDVGGYQGIQAALVNIDGCNTMNPIGTCNTECTLQPFLLQSNDIPAPGTVIIVVLDGCNGSVCDVNFQINSGWTNNPTPPEVDLMLQSQVSDDGTLSCGEMTFTVEPPFKDVCEYVWTLPDGSTINTEEASITIHVNDLPNGSVCVQGINEDCFPGVLFPEDKTICYDLLKDTILAMVYADPTYCGRDNGFAFVENVNGLPPWKYLWSNGGTSSFIDGISAGQYFVTITDAKGCEVIDSVFIAPSDSIRAEIEIVQPDCGESNGSIKVKTRGGFDMGYRYEWLPNFWISADSLVDLSTGIYSVTISDEYDWSCTQIFSNIEIYEELDVNIEEIYHSDMFSNNGFIRFSVENAVEFKYFLTTPTGILEGFDSIIGNLIPAKYKLEIVSLTDEDCQFFFEFVIKGFNRPSPSESIRWNHVLLFPNPVNDILYIEGVEELCSYELYNMSGERLQSAALYNYSINLSEYPRSVYLLKIITINGESIIRKVVKM